MERVMVENEDLDLSGEDSPGTEEKSGAGKWVLVTAVVIVLLAGAGLGAFFFLQGEGSDSEEKADVKPPLVYRALEPELLGNIEGGARVRFVQIGVVLAGRDAKLMESADRHMPVIRNDLLMLLSGKTYEDLITHAGKEATRTEMLETIRGVLTRHTGHPVVESIYFTSFVMQ